MNILKAIGLRALFLLLSLQGAHQAFAKELISKEKRAVMDFKSITVVGSGNLYLQQGSKEALIIEGESDSLPVIQSEVKDQHLFLGPKKEDLKIEKKINYYLTLKNLESIHATDNIAILARATLVLPKLSLKIDGSSKVDLNKVRVNDFNAQITGNGTVKASGSTQTSHILIEEEGEFKGKKLLMDKAKVVIQGKGMALVNVIEVLDVKINGGGKLEYFGNPQIIEEISGKGEIIPL